MGLAASRVSDAAELYVACYARLVRIVALAAGEQAEAEECRAEALDALCL